MAQTKHRDDQFFAAPVEFNDAVTHNDTLDVAGAVGFTGAFSPSGGVIVAGKQLWIPAITGQIGATAGWAIDEDGGLVRCPASQTGSTFVVPISGLHIGDTLTEVNAIAQVESVGGNVSFTMSVRKSTAAAADFTDAELGSDVEATLTADTLIAPAGTPIIVTALTEVLAVGEHLYALFTITNAAVTDVALAGIIAEYTQS